MQTFPEPKPVISCLAPLFVPATRLDRLAKAASSGADAVIVDLEDAVPHDQKAQAREALRAGMLPPAPMILRTNGLATPWFEDDLAAAKALHFGCVMLPKCEHPQELAAIKQRLGQIAIIALIESALGLANARAIAAAGASRLAFGSIDYCASVGCTHRRDILVPARAEIVLASALAGLYPPLDGITMRFDDAAEVREDAEHARAMGFGGKMCIHPKQIAGVKAGFRPSMAEITWANAVLSAGTDGVVKVDNAMVDAPVRVRARQILARNT